jgi:hypothetical protein
MSEVTETPPLYEATVAFNSFVRRQTVESEFSHWVLTDNALLNRIQSAAYAGDYTPSYRPDVVAVHIEVRHLEFYTGVVVLKEGDKLVGEYKARRPGETPRKSLYVAAQQSYTPRRMTEKAEATHVDIILYHHGALAENNEHETECDWEIISVNARDTAEEQPIAPGVLTANYFCDDGGTDTKMTPEEFCAQLKVSREYWKNRAMVMPT